MTKITIKSPKGLILAQKAVDELTDKVGLEVEKVARETAPRSQGEANSDHYKDNIFYRPGETAIIAEKNYSAAIEYGFSDYVEDVKQHQRVIKQAFGKPITPKIVTVKAHTRTMNRKPNPVMRNAAKSVQKEIPALWKETLRENGLK